MNNALNFFKNFQCFLFKQKDGLYSLNHATHKCTMRVKCIVSVVASPSRSIHSVLKGKPGDCEVL